jgi:hypothetical protein
MTPKQEDLPLILSNVEADLRKTILQYARPIGNAFLFSHISYDLASALVLFYNLETLPDEWDDDDEAWTWADENARSVIADVLANRAIQLHPSKPRPKHDWRTNGF